MGPPIAWRPLAATGSWASQPLSREIELRLSPTEPLFGSGFAIEGGLVLRQEARFATPVDLIPHLDTIAREAAHERLQSVLAVAVRAVCVRPVQALLDRDCLRFRIEAHDPPHPACDAQLRLRIERGLAGWLREHWLRRQ